MRETNRRVKNTEKREEHAKKALEKALFDLLQSKQLQDISVQSICDRAQVTRATFDACFESKTDLIKYCFDEQQKELLIKAKQAGGTKRDILLATLDNIEQHIVAFSNMQHDASTLDIKDIVGAAIYQMNYDAISLRSGPQADPKTVHITALFRAGGIISALTWWIEGKAQNMSKEDMLEYLMDLNVGSSASSDAIMEP